MGWLGALILGGPLAAQAVIQRDAQKEQNAALQAARDEDARLAAEAETGAQVAANAQLADSKRRRRASALGMGDPSATTDSLGGGATALAGGAPAGRPAAAGYYSSPSASYGGTALGAGAPASAGRVYSGGGGGGQQRSQAAY